MFNGVKYKQITSLALILWVLQVSVVFSAVFGQGSVNAVSADDTYIEYNVAVQNNNDAPSAVISMEACHSVNELSCDQNHCANCMVIISQEFNTLLMSQNASSLEIVTLDSPRQYLSNLFRPPQTS